MCAKEKEQNAQDDFWDLSEWKRQRPDIPAHAPSVTIAEFKPSVPLTSSSCSPDSTNLKKQKTEDQKEENGVIERYIPPHSDSALTVNDSLEDCGSYSPDNSLIHRVTIKKRKCTYRYYREFWQDAVRYADVRGEACDYVPFFSYVPQYNQLNSSQKAYYFWFRENARSGHFIKTDYSYILLYIYELLNLGEYGNVNDAHRILTELWNAYAADYPAIAGKLADWICDFGLIHHLPPPDCVRAEMIDRVLSLKEYYIPMPLNDFRGCVCSLLQYGTSYHFSTGKFTALHKELFETHIPSALQEAVRYYTKDGKPLSALTRDDCQLVRDAYAGALCVAERKYRLEVSYCSFSRSNELRFLVGDMVKYAENKLRTYVGIKSKMTVYSVPSEVREILDAYFARALPKKCAAPSVREKPAYEALYEVPSKPFSVQDAARIEAESWHTTKDLIEAFEDGAAEEENASEFRAEADPIVQDKELPPPLAQAEEATDWKTALFPWWQALCQLAEGDDTALREAAKKAGRMPEAVADTINEIAFDKMGDALLEEENGHFYVIEDYKELLR